MLRACRKLLRPRGRTAFFTIVVAPGLSKSQHRVAVRRGPRAIRSTRPVGLLMEAAGFVDIEVVDSTDEFLTVARAWEEQFRIHEGRLRAVLGEVWQERQSDRRGMIDAVERGLIRRILVTGTTRVGRVA